MLAWFLFSVSGWRDTKHSRTNAIFARQMTRAVERLSAARRLLEA
jgi:hypothetical protein